jgi:hypothetical protein
MDTNEHESHLTRAIVENTKQLWESGDAIQAGRIIFEAIPNAKRPSWAASVVSFCQPLFSVLPEINEVLTIAQNSSRWREAYEAFQAVRRANLANRDAALENYYRVGELAAKVTYNACEESKSAPFDKDSGSKLVGILRAICEMKKDKNFTEEAFRVVTQNRL